MGGRASGDQRSQGTSLLPDWPSLGREHWLKVIEQLPVEGHVVSPNYGRRNTLERGWGHDSVSHVY